MATELILPEMGEGVTEGTVARWLKAEGEPVKLYEPIVEVETDKGDNRNYSGSRRHLWKSVFPPVKQLRSIQSWPLSAHQASQQVRPMVVCANKRSHLIANSVRTGNRHAAGKNRVCQPQNAGRPSQSCRGTYFGRTRYRPHRFRAQAKRSYYQTRRSRLHWNNARKRRRKRRKKRRNGAATFCTTCRHADHRTHATTQRKRELLPHGTMRRAIARHMVESKHTSPHVTTVFEFDFRPNMGASHKRIKISLPEMVRG